MNKKMIIAISVITAIILLIALICVVFIIGNISVLSTSELVLTNELENKIIQDSKIVKHSSIFSLSEDIATDYIEKENPSLKVVKIERKIPNKVVINITSRIGIAAIPANEGGFWIIDRDLKVIDKIQDPSVGYYTYVKGLTLSNEIQVGDFIDVDWLGETLVEAEKATFIGKRFSSFFTSIEWVSDVDRHVYLTTNSGVIFKIPRTDNLTATIIQNEYQYYLQYLSKEEQTKGTIFVDSEGINYKD